MIPHPNTSHRRKHLSMNLRMSTRDLSLELMQFPPTLNSLTRISTQDYLWTTHPPFLSKSQLNPHCHPRMTRRTVHPTHLALVIKDTSHRRSPSPLTKDTSLSLHLINPSTPRKTHHSTKKLCQLLKHHQNPGINTKHRNGSMNSTDSNLYKGVNLMSLPLFRLQVSMSLDKLPLYLPMSRAKNPLSSHDDKRQLAVNTSQERRIHMTTNQLSKWGPHLYPHKLTK